MGTVDYGPVVDELPFIVDSSGVISDGVSDPGMLIDAVMQQMPDPPQRPEPAPPPVQKEEVVERPLIDPDKPKRDLKTGPPSGDEWLDFFSRIVLRVAMDYYLDFAFKGIDENLVSDRDLERVRVSKDERDTIARPFAEYANKNPWARKHGRQVVALADSAESLIILGIWVRRVNRISAKYKPRKPQRARMVPHEHNGSPAGNPGYQEPPVIHGNRGGTLNGEFGVFNPGGS